ncbi:hypothetical protein BN7_834 [Wickerhamomyces ciferrii]|uniref:RAD50-interacting protein 1 n=1 Tax=Wickerhamomyces ciferrii (strain ATCC 14091 / BCRC 22168 / CBS 111 / JCM 3599 / NBRC 0793 / NRRL Y-1031 F-60-10) TaxID=1206466 RepID=K0KGJ4_WICCF|nr:uncharacterized protein BN7_834 [Wickerhamomyces ciferrii]CCH41297.1 hypothetical protein BN7_834 [Wickerhamomyces ciferrii]
MATLNQWFSSIEDLGSINDKIKALEAERESLQVKSDPNQQQQNGGKLESIGVNVQELSKQLEFSIANSDVATIDALIIGHGEIPSLIAAKNLVLERQRLLNLKNQQLKSSKIEDRLNQVIDFHFDELKSIKNELSTVEDSSLQNSLYEKLDSLVLSLKPQYYNLLVESNGSSKWLNSASVPTKLLTDFHNLLDLQSLLHNQPIYPEPLWSFEILSKNFQVSFDYHFNTQKDTNRIDRPELFFNYLTNYLSSHLSKVNKNFTLHNTSYSDRFCHSEFITALLKPVNLKFQQILEILRDQLESSISDDKVQLMIHLIKETITLDQTLIRDFYYDPLGDGQWQGIFANFTYKDLEYWLNYELKLNLNNYESIINSSKNFQIDYTSVDDVQLKPTVSSIKLKYLLENITNNFHKFFILNYEYNSNLKKFKLKFFANIYLKILESYYERLNDGFQAFNELFKKTRSVLQPNKNSNDIDISGTNGLERLFRIYCSLKYIINALNYWEKEYIFIQLNHLFNEYSTKHTQSLFTSILSDYNNLAIKTMDLITSFYSKSSIALLKNYNQLNVWNDRSSNSQPTEFTPQLASFINTEQDLLQFTSNIVSNTDYIIIKNSLSKTIADFFFQNIIKSNHFSHKGIKQLELDFSIVWEKLQLSKKFPLYKKLIEGFLIMNLNDDQIQQFGPFNTVSQFAKNAKFDVLRDSLQLEYLSDGDLLDLLLRVHS